MYSWIDWLINCEAFSELKLKWHQRLKHHQLHLKWSSKLRPNVIPVGYKEVAVGFWFAASHFPHAQHMAHTVCDIGEGNFSTIEATVTVYIDMPLLRTWQTLVYSPILLQHFSFTAMFHHLNQTLVFFTSLITWNKLVSVRDIIFCTAAIHDGNVDCFAGHNCTAYFWIPTIWAAHTELCDCQLSGTIKGWACFLFTRLFAIDAMTRCAGLRLPWVACLGVGQGDTPTEHALAVGTRRAAVIGSVVGVGTEGPWASDSRALERGEPSQLHWDFNNPGIPLTCWQSKGMQ